MRVTTGDALPTVLHRHRIEHAFGPCGDALAAIVGAKIGNPDAAVAGMDGADMRQPKAA